MYFILTDFDLTVLVVVLVSSQVLNVFLEKIRTLLKDLWACVETQQQDSENQLLLLGKAS